MIACAVKPYMCLDDGKLNGYERGVEGSEVELDAQSRNPAKVLEIGCMATKKGSRDLATTKGTHNVVAQSSVKDH